MAAESLERTFFLLHSSSATARRSSAFHGVLTMSAIAWMDHTESDKRRMLAVIDLFREQDTVDELGMSAVWDAFADLLFPGTGTVQTGARYFLFVPWTFQVAEAQRVPAARAKAAVRRLEVKLIGSLLAGGSGQIGIIGSQAGGNLRRMPSAIYWSGLGRLGIRRFQGSAEQVFRSFDDLHRSAKHTTRDDDGELTEPALRLWDRHLPPVPEGFPDVPLRLELSVDEAEFLRDRIHDSAPDSLLNVLLDPTISLGRVDLPWHHPRLGRFPADVRLSLHHAQRFSEALHGAALLYNLLLARAKGVPEWTEHYEERLSRWSKSLSDQGTAHAGWDREQLWAMVGAARRVHPLAHRFVEDWCDLLTRDGFAIDGNKRAEALLTARERQLKGPLARIGNPRALDKWTGASGDRQYEFRWRSARRVLDDIRAGLLSGA